MQRYFRLDLFLFFKLVDVILGHFIRRSLFRICKGDVLIKNNHRTSSPLVAKACGHFQLVPFDLFRWERVCFKDELFFKNRLGNFLSLAFIHWPDTRGRTWPSSFKILSSATKFRIEMLWSQRPSKTLLLKEVKFCPTTSKRDATYSVSTASDFPIRLRIIPHEKNVSTHTTFSHCFHCFSAPG